MLGCRTDPNQVLLERDLRIQEDKIYELQALLEDCHAAREAAKRENEALKKELTRVGQGPELRNPPAVLPPNGEPGGRPHDEPPLQPPTIELPGPAEGAVEINPAEQSAVVVDAPPTQLVFNTRLTGGVDRDSKAGDEGVLVSFEPRDAEGRLAKAPGAVSIVVLDPTLEGEEARVARWDFQPEEVSNHFHNTIYGRGLQFELPWPSEPPKHRDLRLFVRFTTAEGQKIVAEMPIEVRMPADLPALSKAKTWSPAQSVLRPRTSPPPAATAEPTKPREAAPPAVSQQMAAPEKSTREADRSSADEPRQAAAPDRPEWRPFR